MPSQSKPARVKFLEAPPSSSETTAACSKRPKKLTQSKIDPATLRPPEPDASSNKAKPRPHRTVVFNRVTHERDGSFRFCLTAYCLKNNICISSAGLRESRLLDSARIIRCMNRLCSHEHRVLAPFPLRTKKAITYPHISLRRG
jgi:hypothetical protein